MSTPIKYEITLTERPKFNLGDKLWFLQVPNGTETHMIFGIPCKWCNGKKQIIVDGMLTECPVCKKKNTMDDILHGKELHLTHLEAVEHTIFRIEISSQDEDENPNTDTITPTITKAYAAANNEACRPNRRRWRSVPEIAYNDDDWKEQIENQKAFAHSVIYDLCFKTKEKADEAIEYLKEKDRKELEEFNKKNGTNHVYPW